MDDARDGDDERLRLRQDAVLYPLGRTLRSTYDAENHETLSAEVTALMLNLSRVPFEPCGTHPAPVVGEAARGTPLPVAAPLPERTVAPSFIERVRMLLLG